LIDVLGPVPVGTGKVAFGIQQGRRDKDLKPQTLQDAGAPLKGIAVIGPGRRDNADRVTRFQPSRQSYGFSFRHGLDSFFMQGIFQFYI
jgi:hypothetical protein